MVVAQAAFVDKEAAIKVANELLEGQNELQRKAIKEYREIIGHK